MHFSQAIFMLLHFACNPRPELPTFPVMANSLHCLMTIRPENERTSGKANNQHHARTRPAMATTSVTAATRTKSLRHRAPSFHIPSSNPSLEGPLLLNVLNVQDVCLNVLLSTISDQWQRSS